MTLALSAAELLQEAVSVSASESQPETPVACSVPELLEAHRALPPETVRDALTAILLGEAPQRGLQHLHRSGLLAVWLPEIEATVDFSQEAGRRHKDVWEHTKQVVFQAEVRAPVRWAALLHDVGKVPTRTFTPDGGVHFHRHAEVGARMFDDIARRLVLERTLRQEVRFLILNHLRANQYDASWTDSAVRRFDREMDPFLVDLLDLSRADITSKRPGKRQSALRLIDDLAARIEALREIDAKLPPLPTGIGDAIMQRFSLPPSRRIGELKNLLEAAIESGDLEPRREPDYYLEYLAGLEALSSPR